MNANLYTVPDDAPPGEGWVGDFIFSRPVTAKLAAQLMLHEATGASIPMGEHPFGHDPKFAGWLEDIMSIKEHVFGQSLVIKYVSQYSTGEFLYRK